MAFKSTTIRPVYVTFIIVVMYAVVLVAKDFLGFPDLYQDEYHYRPTAVLFSGDFIPSLEILKTYNHLNTPLPFILGGWMIRLFGEDIRYLRLMNFVLSFMTLLVFVWYKPREHNQRWSSLIPLLAMPSFYLCSIHYYTDMVAWFSVLVGVAAYLQQRNFLAFIAFVAAIASRQYMLAFPVAIGLFEAARIIENKSLSFSGFLKGLWADKSWMFYAAAVLSLVPWILLWGGLAPAAIMNKQHYGDAPFYNPGFVIYVSAITAFYFVVPETVLLRRWSYFLSYPSQYPRTFAFIVLSTGILLFFFPPRQAFNEYFTWPYLGYLDQLLEAFKISGFAKNLIFGVLMIITLMRFVRPGEVTLGGLIVAVNILLLGKAQLSWDKYLFPTLMVLWFFTAHHEERTVRLKKM